MTVWISWLFLSRKQSSLWSTRSLNISLQMLKFFSLERSIMISIFSRVRSFLYYLFGSATIQRVQLRFFNIVSLRILLIFSKSFLDGLVTKTTALWHWDKNVTKVGWSYCVGHLYIVIPSSLTALSIKETSSVIIIRCKGLKWSWLNRLLRMTNLNVEKVSDPR